MTPADGGASLRTEARIHLTDGEARRACGRYWALVRFGSNAIRRAGYAPPDAAPRAELEPSHATPRASIDWAAQRLKKRGPNVESNTR